MLKKIITTIKVAWAYVWHVLKGIGRYVKDFGYNRIYVNGQKNYEESASKAMTVGVFILTVWAYILKFTGSMNVSIAELITLTIAFVILIAILKIAKIAIESNTLKTVSTVPNGEQPDSLAEKIKEIKDENILTEKTIPEAAATPDASTPADEKSLQEIAVSDSRESEVSGTPAETAATPSV